jgi:hypothetical protein
MQKEVEVVRNRVFEMGQNVRYILLFEYSLF